MITGLPILILLLQDVKATVAPKITQAQQVAYLKAKAAYAEAQLRAAQTTQALQSIITEMQKVCPIAVADELPICAPEKDSSGKNVTK